MEPLVLSFDLNKLEISAKQVGHKRSQTIEKRRETIQA